MGKKNKINPEIAKRTGIRQENPEKYYDMDQTNDWLGEGKFARVVKVTRKEDGQVFAAKCIKYDSESLKFALREYDIMINEKFQHSALVKFHDAFIVQKYLILIIDLVDGKNILDWAVNKGEATSLSEEDIAVVTRQFLAVFDEIHQKNFCHLDIRPTNIRMDKDGIFSLKVLDYNSCRHIANKKAGAVVDVIGDTEFCGPEMLSFESVSAASDLWSLGVHLFIMMSGTSPFFDEDEDKTVANVQKVKIDPKDRERNIWDDFEGSPEAKNFIKKIFIRIPENRLTTEKALQHAWLSDDYAATRKNKKFSSDVLERMKATDARLIEEEEEEYIEGSFVFRTFDEEEYESPDEDEEEE
jgi:serine/threonine protein kinase